MARLLAPFITWREAPATQFVWKIAARCCCWSRHAKRPRTGLRSLFQAGGLACSQRELIGWRARSTTYSGIAAAAGIGTCPLTAAFAIRQSIRASTWFITGNKAVWSTTFRFAPHADPASIRLHFEGAGRPRLDAAGDLVFDSVGDALRQHQPVAYQERDGTRTSVEARYRMLPGGDAALELGGYDPDLPLVIDPTLSYATYFGGAGNDGIASIKVDATGALYVAGFTSSASFKTVGGVQSSCKGLNASGQYYGFGDAFVAKFAPSGALVYSTYLGGSDDDLATALAIDASGNAYVAGATRSADFSGDERRGPAEIWWCVGGSVHETGDAFVVKLSPDGGRIVYGTYLGGSMNDMALGIAVDASGNVASCGGDAIYGLPNHRQRHFTYLPRRRQLRHPAYWRRIPGAFGSTEARSSTPPHRRPESRLRSRGGVGRAGERLPLRQHFLFRLPGDRRCRAKKPFAVWRLPPITPPSPMTPG